MDGKTSSDYAALAGAAVASWCSLLSRHVFVVDEGSELLPVDAAGAFNVHLNKAMAV